MRNNPDMDIAYQKMLTLFKQTSGEEYFELELLQNITSVNGTRIFAILERIKAENPSLANRVNAQIEEFTGLSLDLSLLPRFQGGDIYRLPTPENMRLRLTGQHVEMMVPTYLIPLANRYPSIVLMPTGGI